MSEITTMSLAVVGQGTCSADTCSRRIDILHVPPRRTLGRRRLESSSIKHDEGYPQATADLGVRHFTWVVFIVLTKLHLCFISLCVTCVRLGTPGAKYPRARPSCMRLIVQLLCPSRSQYAVVYRVHASTRRASRTVMSCFSNVGLLNWPFVEPLRSATQGSHCNVR